MAMLMREMTVLLRIPYDGSGVRDDANIKVSQINYSTCASGEPTAVKHGGLHFDDTPSIPETISTAELGAVGTEGTVLYKLAAIEADAKTKEGI